jgi:hypothetical protein
MNLSLAIPQLFYDVIARVLPGFLFLFVLQHGLSGTEFELAGILTAPAASSISSLFHGLGYLALCYFCGWSLRAMRWPNLEKSVRKSFEKEGGLSSKRKYQIIRLEHSEAGFRIVKLRAEGRLLEAGRSGMWIAIVLTLTALLTTDSPIATVSWFARLGVPLVFSLAFLSFEKRTWRQYYGNIDTLYALIIDEGRPKRNSSPNPT